MVRMSALIAGVLLCQVNVLAQDTSVIAEESEAAADPASDDRASDEVGRLLQPVDVPGGRISLTTLLVTPPERTLPPPGACVAAPRASNDTSIEVSAAPNVPLGTPHPLWLQRIASDASWVAACQAREDTDGDGNIAVYFGHHGGVGGDEGTLYLMHAGAPEGVPVEEVLAQHGSRVVFRKGREVRMLDFATDERRVLHRSPPSRDGQPVATIREARFSQDGRELLYVLVAAGGTTSLVIHDVGTEAEVYVSAGEGRVLEAAVSGGGAYVSTAVVPADTDGDGQLGAYVRTNLVSGPCAGPALSSSMFGRGGDVVVTRFIRRCDGEVHEGRVIAVTRTGLVVRNEDRSLSWRHIEGDVTPLVPAGCQGRVLEVDVEARALEVSCGRTGAPGVRLRYAPGLARRVGFVSRVMARDDFRLIDGPRSPPREMRFQLRTRGMQSIQIVDTETGEVQHLMSSEDASVYPLGRYQVLQRHSMGAIGLMGVDMVPMGPALVLDMRGDDGVEVLGELPRTPLEVVAGEVGLVYTAPRPAGQQGARTGPIRWMRITSRSEGERASSPAPDEDPAISDGPRSGP